MKVALCLSGHLREYKKTFGSIKTHIIDKFSPDIFISTWDKPGYWTSDDSKGVDDRDITYPGLEKDIVDLYNPVMIDVENLDSTIEFITILMDKIVEANRENSQMTTYRWGRPRNIVGMFYKMWRCNKMKSQYETENNFKYDLVIRCRPDLFIDNYNFTEPKENTIQINIRERLINDLIFCGPSETMDKICNILPWITDICKTTGCIFDPHDILEKSIEYFGLNTQFVNGHINIINTPGGYCREEKKE